MWDSNRLLERVKTVYPESKQPEYTAWEWTGYYRDHNVRTCFDGARDAPPPVEGKTWHHTERTF